TFSIKQAARAPRTIPLRRNPPRRSVHILEYQIPLGIHLTRKPVILTIRILPLTTRKISNTRQTKFTIVLVLDTAPIVQDDRLQAVAARTEVEAVRTRRRLHHKH